MALTSEKLSNGDLFHFMFTNSIMHVMYTRILVIDVIISYALYAVTFKYVISFKAYLLVILYTGAL